MLGQCLWSWRCERVEFFDRTVNVYNLIDWCAYGANHWRYKSLFSFLPFLFFLINFLILVYLFITLIKVQFLKIAHELVIYSNTYKHTYKRFCPKNKLSYNLYFANKYNKYIFLLFRIKKILSISEKISYV